MQETEKKENNQLLNQVTQGFLAKTPLMILKDQVPFFPCPASFSRVFSESAITPTLLNNSSIPPPQAKIYDPQNFAFSNPCKEVKIF